jgi:hypothetical protein
MRVPIVSRASRVPLTTFVHAHRAALLKQALLHGAILLRGWTDADATEFGRCQAALGLRDFAYVGGAAPRTRVLDNVLTANDSPPSEPIPFHHELAQARRRPSHLLLFCETPAARGGRPPLVDSRAVASYVARAHPAVAARLDEGVRYTRILPPHDDPQSAIGRSWRSAFRCTTRREAEVVMRRDGLEWQWCDGGLLWTRSPALPAFRHARADGSLAFCNAILAAHLGWNDRRNEHVPSVAYADGAPLDAAFLEDVVAFADANASTQRWEKGDVLLIDNAVTMHSRQPFEGERRVLTCLCTDDASRHGVPDTRRISS